MKCCSRWYVKYIIKNQTVFYTFLVAGILLFLYLSLGLKLDVRQSVTAQVQGNQIIVSEHYETPSDVIYLYRNRGEKIHKLQINQIEYADRKTIFVIENSDDLSGDFQADVVTGSSSLLQRIFINAGKGS